MQLRVIGLNLNDVDPYSIDAIPEEDKPQPRRKGMNVKIDAQTTMEAKAMTAKINGSATTEIKGGVVKIN